MAPAQNPSRRPKIGDHAAVFPPGYEAPWLVRVLLYAAATNSQAMRRICWGLRSSRFRTYLVSSYYHLLVRDLGDGHFSSLPAIDPEAELTVFTFGTHLGPEGWRDALASWRDTLDVDLEMSAFENLGRDHRALISIRFTGRGASSAIGVDAVNYFVVEIRDGLACWGRFFADRSAALAAAGLESAKK